MHQTNTHKQKALKPHNLNNIMWSRSSLFSWSVSTRRRQINRTFHFASVWGSVNFQVCQAYCWSHLTELLTQNTPKSARTARVLLEKHLEQSPGRDPSLRYFEYYFFPHSESPIHLTNKPAPNSVKFTSFDRFPVWPSGSYSSNSMTAKLVKWHLQWVRWDL